MATFCVDNGLGITTNRLKGAGGAEPLQIGWATGSVAIVATSTGFTGGTERDVDLVTTTGSRTTGTSSQQTTSTTNDTYRVTGTRTATGSGTVTGGGLWDNATIGSGTLYMAGDFTGIGLASGDSIAFTCNVQYTN